MSHFKRTTTIIQLLLLCFSCTSFVDLTRADPPFNVCSEASTYGNAAKNSPFQSNLQNLMSSLSSNASVSKQYNASAGNDPDRVYAQYMCLNYITNESCSICILTASQDILQICSYSKEAIVWEEVCQLRYSNQSFLGQVDVSFNNPRYNMKNISKPEQYRLVVNETLSNLSKRAAYDSSAKMYATGEVAFADTATDMLHALVQCTTDLSPHDCDICLRIAIANVLNVTFSVGARLISRSCYLRFELYAFYKGATEPPQKQVTGKSSQNKIWIIMILTVISALLVAAFLGCFVYRLSVKKGYRHIGDHMGDLQHQNFQGRDGLKARESAFMDLASLYAATNNFSELNMLGQGGFGPVYKGILRDGKEVAVKRLSTWSEQGTEEFTNEVLLIMKLQHKNLVRLLGFCVDGNEKLLVYEFLPNSSLDVILFDPKKREQLDWSKRTSIINGIARGILYLHEDSRLRIIHRDLKASNILLDNDMNPKISDFGMARILEGADGQGSTSTIVGTYGYMAPEYAMVGLYSSKSDVFSFGVLLLEIITGRRNAGFHNSERAPSLLEYAWQLWNEENEVALMDPLLNQSCCSDEFSRLVHIGLLCVQEDACDRPTMSSVVLMLKSESASLPPPERPAFSVGRFTEQNQANAIDSSINGQLTISDMLPR